MGPITGGKTLLLMRHAKSDWAADYESDHERPLNERGVRSATLIGRLIETLDLKPDIVLHSTATRATETAHLAADAGRWECELVPEKRFYGGSPDSVLDIVAGVSDADRLMLVGHEPVWSSLVGRVTGRRTEMKTGTVAVVRVPLEEWAELPETEGVLVALHHPRSYFGSRWDPG